MSDESQWVNTDAEIHAANEDRLDRVPFCRRLVERIVNAGDGPSVVFGLAGPWGSGKTSVLNIVDELLTQEFGQDWAVVRFTAWSASDVEALTDEFYRAIAAAMPQDTPEGRRAVSWLLSMAPVAAAAGKAAAVSAIEAKLGKGVWAKTSEATVDALADRVGKFKIQPDPFITRFEKMSRAIDQAGRNVVVVVDDIDRLHTDELLGVMKAVRLLGRFNRVHYLLSYDQQTVLDVLKSSDIANGDERRARHYLEKIVQYPFVVPPLQISQIEAALDNALRGIAKSQRIDVEPGGSGRWGSIERIIHALPDRELEQMTLRRINRLASQVEVLFMLVGQSDLNFIDAVLVTFIRLWYPSLYDQLPRWQSKLVKGVRLSSFSATGNSARGASWPNLIADALSIPSDQRADNPDLDAVTALLSTLFPGAVQKGGMRQDGEICRIDTTEYFSRYFSLRIPTDDISDETVRAELASLCVDGELATSSAVLGMLADRQTTSRVLGKVLRVLDVVTESPAGNTAAAARFLNSLLPQGDRLFGRWGTVLYALLGHAVRHAGTAEEAQRVIEDFAADAGLLATAEVLFGSVPPAGTDPTEMIAASKPVSSRVVDVCRRDLALDLGEDSADALTCLHFWRFWSGLPAEVTNELAIAAEELMATGTVKPHELGGRFVVVPEAIGTNSPFDVPQFHVDEFETLVPREKWVLDEIPEVSEADVVPGDRSLRNRINAAALEIRRLTSSAAADNSS